MIERQQLVAVLADLLQPQLYSDYCPNGLQVEGKSQIKKIVTGVTASHALLQAAVNHNADAVLVHHGIFWKADPLPIVGIKHKRVATLIQHDINLFAYHLPLDCHLEYGNNKQLAERLGIQVTQHVAIDQVSNLLWIGEFPHPMDAAELTVLFEQCLQRRPLLITPPQQHKIQRVAWCTGAAQKLLTVAKNYDVDAYISGEISEETYHSAQELGLYYIAAGHHATERYGIQALGRYLAEKFQLEHQFIEIDNPV